MNPTAAGVEDETAVHGRADFSSLHSDIIDSHIFTRLDGPSLAAASCSSAALHRLSSRPQLWFDVCHSTWPSTASPRVSRLMSEFPDGGPRGFFAQSFLLPLFEPPAFSSSPSLPSELISAVDIRHRNELVFSKVQEAETVTGWFRCSPFRIDLLEPKDVIPTSIPHPAGDAACSELMEDMSLSWILMDPTANRVVNLSSHKPVSVTRHWLSGEVQVRFASVLPTGDQNRPGRAMWGPSRVQCGILITCGKSESGDMQVREVSMEMENMDGMHLNGRESLVILDRALEGKSGKSSNREEEARKRYEEYVEMKKEKKESRLRTERVLDSLCVAFGVSIFVAFLCFLWCR